MTSNFKEKLKKLLGRNEVTTVLAVLLLAIIFSLFSNSFLTAYNLFNLGRTAAIYIFISIAQALVIIVGGMNLSLGFIGGLSVVAVGYSIEVVGIHPVIAVIIGLTIGVLAGLLNGFIITFFKLNSFVVTLATSFIFTGLINGVSQGYPYDQIPSSFTIVGRGGVLGIPYVLWLATTALAVLGYLFKYTVVGRRVLATGGNTEVAKMSGINTNRMIILANAGSGLFAAIAGVLWISRTGSAQPSTGADWMLISFAVAVIGGTVLKGGVFNPCRYVFCKSINCYGQERSSYVKRKCLF